MPAVLTASFQRIPQNHGDLGVWNSPALQQMRRGSLGGNSIDVSNVGGSLNVDLGFAGISNGVTEGTMQVTTAGSFSLAGSTLNSWHALEFSVSSTSVTFYLTALAGETDHNFMSLTMKGYYDAAKCGYYRIASRRVLAFVFIYNSGGATLGRIVNTENGIKGFKGIKMIEYYTAPTVKTLIYIDKCIADLGAWNMDSTDRKIINACLPFWLRCFGTLLPTVKNVNVFIYDDSGVLFPLMYFTDGTVGIMGGIENYVGNTVLFRTAGGFFDSVQFDDAVMNRGFVIVEYET